MTTISLDEEFQQLAEEFQKKAKLTPQQLKAFKLTKVEDIRTVLADVQKKHEKERACIWLRRLDPFINTFLEFGNIIEVFLNTSDFLAFIWGPLKWLLWITRNYCKAFGSLLDLYRDLSKQLNFLQAVKSQMNDSNNIRQVLVWIYKDILDFHVKAMEFFAKGRWGQLFESNWRGFTDSVSQIKASLSLNSRLIDSHVSVTILEEVRLLRQKFSQESEDRRIERALKRKTAVLNWLNPSSREIIAAHESHLEARRNNPGSCEWIMEQTAFQQWYDLVYCRTPLLWISGKPGAGKSVVASYIVEEVQKHSDVSTVYFYFSHQKPFQDNFLSMATTLVAQLMQHDALIDYLHSIMIKGHAGNVSTKAEAERLLDFSLRLRKTFVILDGLDECCRDERLHICEWFRSIIETLDRRQHGDIRCLFICQEDGIANKDLRDIAHLRITPELNRKDILSFSRIAQNNIETSLGSCPLGQEQASISDIVTHRANGMFIYAKLVLDELKSYPTKGLITEHWSPEKFPDQISEVYDRILQRLNSQAYEAQARFRNRILTFICVAKRPLRWFELQAVISLNPERNIINRDEDRTPRTCEEICASFVQVQKDETVVLVHSTARDFLVSREVVVTLQGEMELCRLSIAYLNFDDFCREMTEDATRSSLLRGRYGFFEYAVLFWPFHLLSTARHSGLSITDLSPLLSRLIRTHWVPGTVKSRLSLKIERLFEPISTTDYYRSLVQAIDWAKKQLLIAHTNKVNTGKMNLLDVAERFRVVLTTTATTPIDRDKLQKYYGTNLYKCPKPFCQFFSVGFDTSETLDSHVNRHDRPYMCTVEGCFSSILGFVDQKSLDYHIRKSHGYLREKNDFPLPSDLNSPQKQEAPPEAIVEGKHGPPSENAPEPERQPASKPVTAMPDAEPHEHRRERWRRDKAERTARVLKHPRRFRCSECGASFTRASILRAHRRAHANDRPFICTICNATFVRLNDKKRHDRRHAEPLFVCSGELGNGQAWGCGMKFGRKDALEAHLGTEKGYQCLEGFGR